MSEIVPQNNTIVPTQNQILNLNDINNNENTNLTTNPNYKISYEKNEKVLLMIGSKSEVENNNIKEKQNNYSLVNIDDPDLFDGKIKCAKLKCIVFGFLTFFINLIRLCYLLFLHLGYPFIIWGVRCTCCCFCFICVCCQEDTRYIEPETKRPYIGDEGSSTNQAFELVKNCSKALWNFLLNFFKCPCWFIEMVKDCFYDIKNRALDNTRIGCYKYIHNDCGTYSKCIEEPFNDYNKKKHIILETDPHDPSVVYGEACQNNILI